MDTNVVVLVSGGLDSFVVSQVRRPQAERVFVQTDVAYAHRDFIAAKALYGAYLKTINGPTLQRYAWPDGYIPHRNLALLVTLSQVMPDVEEFVVSAPNGEMVNDSTAAFFAAATDALRESAGKRVLVSNGARGATKAQLIREYVGAGLPVMMLYRTRACYDAHAWACGRCAACVKHYAAFINAGVTPPRMDHDPRIMAREMLARWTLRKAWRMGARAAWEMWRAYQ